ncbi:MAG: putative CoA-transferase family protein [Acidimicrobiaceae bacterium]|nr:putative CoA-transferase family protein [Acidimicrobiaceae bacterium]
MRILALEQYGAGPFGTAQLVDLGADVIKIEDPATGGDVGRAVPPFRNSDGSLFFETFNRGKRSVLLDLRNASGRAVFDQLVASSDAVFANVRGDVPEKLGIRYSDLCHLNRSIVCCFLTSFGVTGSEQADPGYDYVMQGRAGWMSLTGSPDEAPQKTGLSLVDFSTGLAAAMALLAGVIAARETGVGTECDVALFDTAISMLSYVATWHLSEGYEPTRTALSAHPSLIPFQNFPTADGWLVVACAKEKFWRRLVDVIGKPEWKSAPEYATFEARRRNADLVVHQLCQLFSERSTADWLEILVPAGVPCGPVNDVSGALSDPLVAEREMIVETSHPSLGAVRQVASSARVGGHGPVIRRGPLLGEHTNEVLTEVLGLDGNELKRLDAVGAFGDGKD